MEDYKNAYDKTYIDYSELLCTATKIIVDNAINDVRFDQTVECTIKDASKAKKGIYRVNNGSATFVAYSYDEYREGDSVYVLVPNGDYNNDKTIIGKKVKDKTIPYHYIAPFDNLLDITGNLLTVDIGAPGLTANMPKEYNEEVVKNDNTIVIERRTDGWEKQIFELTPDDLNNGKGYEDFTRLGIRASFQSWLSEYHCAAGNYGLRIEIIYRSSDTIEKSENPKDLPLTQTEIILDCADMIGNPYAFESFYQQEKQNLFIFL